MRTTPSQEQPTTVLHSNLYGTIYIFHSLSNRNCVLNVLTISCLLVVFGWEVTTFPVAVVVSVYGVVVWSVVGCVGETISSDVNIVVPAPAVVVVAPVVDIVVVVVSIVI